MSEIVEVKPAEISLFGRVEQLHVAAANAVAQAAPDQTWMGKASDLDRMLSNAEKGIEDARTSATKPINDGLKAINNLFKPYKDGLKDARDALKGALKAQNQEIQRLAQVEADEQRRAAEEDAIAEAERLEEVGEDVAASEVIEDAANLSHGPVVPIGPTRGDLGSRTSFVDHWKARVVDANLVPREFMIPNEKMLSQYAKDSKGKTELPGIEIYNDQQVRTA